MASDETRPLGASQRKLDEPAPRDCFSLLGTVVEGRYLVERLVGSGGYGVVYRARHLRLDSPVALKVLRIASSVDPERRAALIKRFAAEGRLAFGLGGRHSSIARVLECGLVCVASEPAGPLPYLAMEWLDGLSLSQQLQLWRCEGRAPLSLEVTLALLTPIAEALAAAHDLGIAHRDVKPANIMLAQRGTERSAVLLDFGLAKASVLVGNTTERFDESDEAPPAFTPGYAAPEQWLRRLGATGPWTDVHALALVCVELLTGRHPFEAEDTQQLLAACVDPEVRPLPRRFGIPCARSVELVFERALCVTPRDRFRDARSFWSALCAAHASPERKAKSMALGWRRLGWGLALAGTLALAGRLLGDRVPPPPAGGPPASHRGATFDVVQASTITSPLAEPVSSQLPAVPAVTSPPAARPRNRVATTSRSNPEPEKPAPAAAPPEPVASSVPHTDLPADAPVPQPQPLDLLQSNAFSLRK